MTMNTPTLGSTFTHSVEISQFRTEEGEKDYRAFIDKLLETGGSFAVTAGKLWLSDFSLKVCQELYQTTKGTP